jgi:hypothetical protein
MSNTGKTWWKKGHISWNKGSTIVLKPHTGWTIICIVCGTEKYYQLNEHKKRKRVYCSPACYHEDSRKKENLSYSTIHHRIISEYGRADKCEDCGATKNIDWANLDHEYTLDRNKWKKMCRTCHFRYDYKNGWGKAFKKFPYMRYK